MRFIKKKKMMLFMGMLLVGLLGFLLGRSYPNLGWGDIGAIDSNRIYFAMEKEFIGHSMLPLEYEYTKKLAGETWQGTLTRGDMRVDLARQVDIYTFEGYLTKVEKSKK